ncbi:capsid protein [Enterobacter hormaechei]
MSTPNAYAGSSFRPHYDGDDNDIHVEAYDRDVATQFEHKSLFVTERLSKYKPLSNSNTYRADRLSGNFEVRGRSSGEKLESTTPKMEKLIVTADTTTYSRVPIDYQDEWTAPSFRKELATNAGTSHALSFDQAHAIQLIKASQWEVPPTLAGTFSPLAGRVVELPEVQTAEEAADAFVEEIKAAVNTFLMEKDLSCHELTLLVDPALFSVLLDHKKLMNVQYSRLSGNDFSARRIGFVAGVRVIECNSFPQAAVDEHPLGDDYTVTADEVRTQAVLFHAPSVLVTVEAKSLTNRVYDDERDMTYVLDTFRMYNVGLSRPDLVIAFKVPAAE